MCGKKYWFFIFSLFFFANFLSNTYAQKIGDCYDFVNNKKIGIIEVLNSTCINMSYCITLDQCSWDINKQVYLYFPKSQAIKTGNCSVPDPYDINSCLRCPESLVCATGRIYKTLEQCLKHKGKGGGPPTLYYDGPNRCK